MNSASCQVIHFTSANEDINIFKKLLQLLLISLNLRVTLDLCVIFNHMEVERTPINFTHFTLRSLWFFKIIGIGVHVVQSLRDRTLLRFYVVCYLLFFLQVCWYLPRAEDETVDTAYIISVTFYVVACFSKIISMVYKRPLLVITHACMRDAYPRQNVELQYKLERHLKSYLLAERIILIFYSVVMTSTVLLPLLQSCYAWWSQGHFGYRMLLLVWFPVPLEGSAIVYFVNYVVQGLFCSLCWSITLGCDLYLFCAIDQICMYFDLATQMISELQPNERESLVKLQAIVKIQQTTQVFIEDINNLFIPPILIGLLFSSFIICFTLYQLLGDVSAVFIFRAVIVLIFEFQQIYIICYFGDKLKSASEKLFHALYGCNWIDGSVQYRRLVLFMMMHTMRPKALIVAGVSDVSLVTMRKVLAMSYQLFTVLKSARG